MEEQTIESPQQKSKGKGALALILGVLLLGSLGSNYWLWDKEQKASATATAKVDSLNELSVLKDSLYKAINDEELKVFNLRTELSMYQNDNDSLRKIIEEKEAKIMSLRAMVGSGGSPKKLRALKDSISRLSMENNDFKTKVQTLLMENEDYKAKMLDQQNQIATLEGQKKNLSDKVTIAAEPSVGPVIVTPMYQKKGVYTPIYKAKKVERLQITFDVMGNKLTEKTLEKEYIIRVIDPDGIVLSTSNSKLSNSDDVFTAKQKVSFNGTQQKMKINFTQSPSYKKGKYKVELKEGEEVKQSFSFDLL